MFINGAILIKLQELNGVKVDPNHALQGKRNWLILKGLGATKGSRQRQTPQKNGPKSGTEFRIPEDRVLEALTALGIRG
jgi:hypothetical protein